MADDSSLPSSVTDLARLGQLMEEYRPRLLAMLRRRIDPTLGVRIDPEEVLQDAYLRARQRWPRFREEGRMQAYPWLYRIVLDCLIEAWRSQTRGCRDLHAEMPWPEQSSMQLAMGLAHSGTSPSSAFVREEQARQVRKVIELLREKDREVLRMRHDDDLSFAEIGELLGASENAATVRYVRALKRLRELWQRLYPDSELQP